MQNIPVKTAETTFEFYGYQEHEGDEPYNDDRYYYHAFLGDIIACYIDVFVTDGEITDQTMHLEWTSGKFEGETLHDLVGNEFELPPEVEADVKKRIAEN